jgi:hypothetical protein
VSFSKSKYRTSVPTNAKAVSFTVSLVAGPLEAKVGKLSYLYAVSKALAFGLKGLAA